MAGGLSKEVERTGFGRRRELMSLALIGLAVFGGWYAFTAFLQTPTPFFVVSSGSMIPALEVGDIILVNGGQRVDSLEIGEIIVFTLPTNPTGDRVIVHRVNGIIGLDGEVGLKTKGDNNPSIDGWTVREREFIGKVILRIPAIGWLAIWLAPPLNYYAVVLIVLLILAVEYGFGRRRDTSEYEEIERTGE
ncbi:MAG: signal peptidase I [Nitrososphaerales archaeon]